MQDIIKKDAFAGLYLLYLRNKNRGRFMKSLEESLAVQFLSPAKLRELQFSRLKSLLMHAYANVPFYKDLYDRHGVDPGKIRKAEDISLLPVVGKEDLRAAYKKGHCFARNLPVERRIAEKTSGSTNEPFLFYKDSEEELPETCALIRQKLLTGYRLGEPSMLMRGLQPSVSLKSRIISFLFRKRSFLQIFDISEETLPGLAKQIRDRKIQVIECFPSGLLEIARYIQQNSMQVNVKAVIYSGEKLSETNRRIIEEALHTKVYGNYGAAEAMDVAYECEMHSGLHVDISRYVLEIVNDNRPCRPGTEGEILITNLGNYVMPFIRYRIGDRASFAAGTCACKRTFPRIESIRGRIIENFRTPEGKVLNYHYFSTLLDEEYLKIRQYQIVLKSQGRLVIDIVPTPLCDKAFLEKIRNKVRAHIGKSMSLEIRLVDDIPRGRTGKRVMMRNESRT